MEVEEEEEPCYILSIPNELQLMIFDKMEQLDKISYGKTSRKCRAIWKESKSLFDGISWDNLFDRIVLSVNDSYPFKGNGQFVKFFPNHYEFGSNDTDFRQRKECKNGFEIAEEKFVKTLEKYQNTVKSITIYEECNVNLRNISSFPSLRYLILRDCPNFVREVLSKSVNALEYLEIYIDARDNEINLDLPEIYRVFDYLSINFGLTREQLFKLSAKNIRMPIGNLKPEDIFEFIKSWQNGRRNIKCCEWEELNDFDAPKFFGFFNTQVINRYKRITIRGIGGKSAEIIFRKGKRLEIEVFENPQNIGFDGEGRYDRIYRYSSGDSESTTDSESYTTSDTDSAESDSD
ncbi:unnamed protein product [Caenorhabditis angaria]|uniref:F-box domain-containing protein n=1 Tax=Caenorhabditis angaria TaxID=860376 RepID=A0A9P1ISU0_9PELO|nr:unnamed protein product [Caenorhabditis angaria]